MKILKVIFYIVAFIIGLDALYEVITGTNELTYYGALIGNILLFVRLLFNMLRKRLRGEE